MTPQEDADTQNWRAGLGARLDRQDEQILALINRADDQTEQMDSVRGDLEINTRKTDEVVKNTQEMVEMFRSWQGAMRVLEMLGKAAKPLAAIASLSAAIGAWYFNWRTGK